MRPLLRGSGMEVKRQWAAMYLLVCFACGSPAPPATPPSKARRTPAPPPSDLPFSLPAQSGAEPHILQVLGPDAQSCGRFQGDPYLSGRGVRGSIKERVAECISGAARAKRGFFFSVEGSAVDSWVATGLIGATDGTLKVFWYDSAPCGGPGCPESFMTYDCPKYSASHDINPELECSDAEMWTGP
jgi:hypothetical protein